MGPAHDVESDSVQSNNPDGFGARELRWQPNPGAADVRTHLGIKHYADARRSRPDPPNGRYRGPRKGRRNHPPGVIQKRATPEPLNFCASSRKGTFTVNGWRIR